MADPITAIGLAASVVQLIDTTLQVIQYANNVKGASADQARFGMEASSLLALLVSLRYNLEQSTAEDAWFVGIRSIGIKDGPLDQLKEALESVARKLQPQSGLKKLGSKLIWPIEKQELVSVLQRIERTKTLISLAYNRDNLALSLAIKSGIDDVSGRIDQVSEGVKTVEIHLSKQKKEEILSWLSPLTYESKHNDLFHRYQDGTCKWLLEADEFQEWQATTGEILWCPGMPGAGKTTLASFVINELERSLSVTEKTGLAYIYCNYKSEHQTAINIVGSLLRQLLHGHVVPQCVVDLYDTHNNKSSRPKVWELTKCLKQAIEQFSYVYFIIDALDEYDEGDGVRDVLTGELLELVPLPNSHVLVTSRWLSSIERAFEGSLRLEIRATDQDVTKYVEQRIENSSRLRRRMNEDSKLKSDVVETMVERCQGMFLLARLHMDNLATKPSVRAIQEALKVIPRKLEETYDLVMQRISDQNEDDANLARRLLSWLTYSVRPLTVVELQHALAIEPGQDHLDSDNLIDEEIMLSVCAGIVTVEDESNLIRFIHYTTQEYLERIRDARFPTARLEITEACIQYLQQGPVSEPLRNAKFTERVRSRPFYEYAALNWGAHADEDVQRVAETRILELLKNNPRATAIDRKYLYHPGDGNRVLPPRPGVHIAAYRGLSHILECQIKHGINSEVYDNLGRTPIHVAVSRNQRECVRILLDNDRVYGKELHRAWTLMRIAAIQGLPEFARLAIESEADFFSQPDPIAISYRGWTVLHEAVFARHMEVVEILCDSRFEPNSVDLEGNSALHLAATEGYDDILRTLVRKGANINKRNKCGETPLHHATMNHDYRGQNNCKLCIQSLLEFGAEVNCMDNAGRTPLYGALMWGKDTAQLILQSGGCLNLTAETFKFARNILGSGCRTPFPPTVVLQGKGISLDQANQKYSKTAKVLREERLGRLRHHGNVIDISGFEKLLEIDSCYSFIRARIVKATRSLLRYRRSWFVRDIIMLDWYYRFVRRDMANLAFRSLSQKFCTLYKLRKRLYDGPAEEDVRPILRLIDDCFDTTFDELEKFKRAVEDIFNPIQEEYCNVLV